MAGSSPTSWLCPSSAPSSSPSGERLDSCCSSGLRTAAVTLLRLHSYLYHHYYYYYYFLLICFRYLEKIENSQILELVMKWTQLPLLSWYRIMQLGLPAQYTLVRRNSCTLMNPDVIRIHITIFCVPILIFFFTKVYKARAEVPRSGNPHAGHSHSW